MSEKINACDDCGILFDTPHDVQRHVKRGQCYENDEPERKKRKLGDSELDLESDKEPDENEGFINLWQKAQENEDIKLERLKDRYLADGESDEDATDMAEKRIQSYNERRFFQLYAQLL